MSRKKVSQSGQALFLSSEELDRLSSSVLLNILCLLRNVGRSFTSFCVPLCFVKSSEGRKEALPPFESVMATNGRMENLTFDVCTLEERELSFAWFVSFCVFFSSHTRSSTGEVSLLARSHVACVFHHVCAC